MTRFALTFSLSILSWIILLDLCSSQNFDPNTDDKEYLDKIEKKLRNDVVEAHKILVNQTKILQHVTRNFIESKLKENLFKAVRARVEVELETMAANNVTSSRQARQDEDEEEEATAVPITQRPRPGLLPQLANVVNTLFGANANVTGYVKDATSFLPDDLSKRFIVAASLIDPKRFTAPTTLPPLIVNGQVIPQGAIINGTFFRYPVNTVGVVGSQTTGALSGNVGEGLHQGAIQPGKQPISVTNGLGLQSPLFASSLGIQPASQGQGQYQSVQSSFGAVPLQQTSNAGQLPEQRLQPITAQQPTFQQTHLNLPQLNLGTGGLSGVANNELNLTPEQQEQYLSGLPLPASQTNSNIAPLYASVSTTPATSNEEEDNNSSADESNNEGTNPQNKEEDSSEVGLSDDNDGDGEDDLPDEATSTLSSMKTPGEGGGGLSLQEYPVVKYAVNLFNRIRKTEIPTTTEYMKMNVSRSTTVKTKSQDSLEEEEMAATSPATSTVSRLVQGGVYIYEGAKEAYHFLQHINKFLDRVNERFENAGYGAEDVGVNVADRKEKAINIQSVH